MKGWQCCETAFNLFKIYSKLLCRTKDSLQSALTKISSRIESDYASWQKQCLIVEIYSRYLRLYCPIVIVTKTAVFLLTSREGRSIFYVLRYGIEFKKLIKSANYAKNESHRYEIMLCLSMIWYSRAEKIWNPYEWQRIIKALKPNLILADKSFTVSNCESWHLQTRRRTFSVFDILDTFINNWTFWDERSEIVLTTLQNKLTTIVKISKL